MVTTGCPRPPGPEPPPSHTALIKTRLRNINSYIHPLHYPTLDRPPPQAHSSGYRKLLSRAWRPAPGPDSLLRASGWREGGKKGQRTEVLHTRKSSGKVNKGLACWGRSPGFEHHCSSLFTRLWASDSTFLTCPRLQQWDPKSIS